jgi:hypothetical protein
MAGTGPGLLTRHTSRDGWRLGLHLAAPLHNGAWTAGAGQQPGRLGVAARLGPSRASGRPAQVRSAGAGVGAPGAVGIVLDDGSYHVSAADRRTPRGDKLAGHKAYATPGALAAPASKSSGEHGAGAGRDS